MKSLLTTHDAAELLGLHPFTVGRHLDQGVLKGHRTAGGHRRIQASELVRYLRAQGRPIPPELSSVGGSGFHLLLVDDEPLAIAAIKRAFKPLAGEVTLTTTTSAMQGLLMAADLRPDGLLIDVNMPDLNGYELCERVLKYPTLSHLKVVTMTAHLKTDVLGSSLRAGALACLEKPINPKEVMALLNPPVVDKRRGRRLKAG